MNPFGPVGCINYSEWMKPALFQFYLRETESAAAAFPCHN